MNAFEEFHIQPLRRAQCGDGADRVTNERRKIGETLVSVIWSLNLLGVEHRCDRAGRLDGRLLAVSLILLQRRERPSRAENLALRR